METRWASKSVNKAALQGLTETKLLALGWMAVRKLNGSSLDSWHAVAEKMVEEGMINFIRNGWPTIPIIIENQRLFKMKSDFVNKVESSIDASQLLRRIGSHRVYTKISSGDLEFTSQSSAWSLSVDGLVDYEVPSGLHLTKLDAIASFGLWYTGGHVETGGDDSITRVPVGKKLMIIAERGYHSRLLEKLLQSTKAFVNFLLKGPSTNAVRNKVRFYVTTPTSLMIQPSLCAHTVITLSEGPAIVAGFEAKLVEDDLRQRQVLNYYSPGMRKETKFLAVQTCTYTTLSNYLLDTGRSQTELGQHVECFKVDGKNCGRGKKGRKSRHQRRTNNLPSVQKKAARMQKLKKGKRVFVSPLSRLVSTSWYFAPYFR